MASVINRLTVLQLWTVSWPSAEIRRLLPAFGDNVRTPRSVKDRRTRSYRGFVLHLFLELLSMQPVDASADASALFVGLWID